MQSNHSEEVQSHISQRFHILKKVGSGAYGHVWKVKSIQNGQIYALKKIFDAFQHATDAQRTYREIQILRQINHPNIVKLYETIPAINNKDVYLLFQFMECDLHSAISDNILKDIHFRFITYQLAKALKYIHSGLIIHRDLKPSNILINSDCQIKLCDFGLVRSIAKASSNNPVLTQGVATRWYRSPQVLLGSKSYSTPADIWSFGCIIFEIIARKPLFTGTSTIDQLQKIIEFTGVPSSQDIDSIESQVCKSLINQIKTDNTRLASNIMKTIPIIFQDLLSKMIVFNPKKRITIDEILKHPIINKIRKQQTQIKCSTILSTPIDDNKKLTVDEYRSIIYHQKKCSLKNPLVYIEKKHNDKQLKKIENINQNLKPKIKKSLSKIKSCNHINDIQNIPQVKGVQTPTHTRHPWKKIIINPSENFKNYKKLFTPTSKMYSPKQTHKIWFQKKDIFSGQLQKEDKQIKPQTYLNPNLNLKKSGFDGMFWNEQTKSKQNHRMINISPKNYFFKKTIIQPQK